MCVHNWSVSKWKQYELQIWSSWIFLIFSNWKAPWNSTPENGHAHGECFWCFHSCTWRIKTLPQSPISTEEISLYTVHIKSTITKFCFWSQRLQNVPQSNVMCVEMFHDQHPQTISWRTDFLFHQNFTPVTVLCHCIRRQCFTLLPNVWVVLKIYFAILHKIVTINNVQQSIKQAKGKENFFLRFALHPVSHVTHLGRLPWAHDCMEEMWYAKGVWWYFWRP